MYNKIFNKPWLKRNGRKLRNNMTPSEVILWSKIKNKRLGYKFRRQQGIDRYIIDFYCPDLKLVIEVDGLTHDSDNQIAKDNNRQKTLENLGLIVKRYTDNLIVKDIDSVIRDLQNIINDLR